MKLFGASVALSVSSVVLAHYGKPPCPADEHAVTILIGGEYGQICAAPCKQDSDCPTDTPADFGGSVHCGFPTKNGSHFCELDCIASSAGDNCGLGDVGGGCEPYFPMYPTPGVCAFPMSGKAAPESADAILTPPQKETSASHPTLPSMWTAYVNELQVGQVYESENFASDKDASSANPSAKWTNFTDGSCKRLIYSNGTDITWSINKRFLLGCGQADENGEQGCCHEKGDGPIEYQIPNVHPAFLAPVKSLGKENITKFDKSTVEADVWSWNFLGENVKVYTTNADNGLAELHRWVPSVSGTPYPNEYVNHKAVAEADAAAFKRSFDIPAVCRHSKKCSSAALSDQALQFLRAGRSRRHIGELLV